MKLKTYLILISIISTLFAIYFIWKYNFNYIILLHWIIVCFPAIFFLTKKK